MGEADRASARESLTFVWRTAPSVSLHWYEAEGVGRKEFKIKHLL
jgi:hypothetical protein